ncbi:hypothetical protein GCM10007908_03360 [Rhizobium albus]|nr:hypothetical protein GCM10007908_03360 [Rhizobium albus]
MTRTTFCAFALLASTSIASAERTSLSCQADFMAEQSAGLVRSFGLEGETPVVVVNDRLYAALPFERKEYVAETLNCAAAGPGNVFARIEFRSDLSNNPLAVWEAGSGLTVE